MEFIHAKIVSSFLAGGGVLLLASLQPVMAAPVSSGTCSTNKTKFVVSENLHTTSSTSFVKAKDAVIDFTSSVAGCMKVTFSAEASTANDESMSVRVLIDNGGFCRPADALFVRSAAVGAHAMTFFCEEVPAGAHTLKVEFRSNSGANVTLGFRTTEVSFR
jgi:hypothetical protein